MFISYTFPALFSAEKTQATALPWTAPATAARQVNPSRLEQSATPRIQQLYRKECLPCHGPGGKGDGPKASDLKVPPGDLSSSKTLGQSDGALFWKLTRGRTPMPSYRTRLSAQDRWMLIAYLRTFAQPGVSLAAQSAAQTPADSKITSPAAKKDAPAPDLASARGAAPLADQSKASSASGSAVTNTIPVQPPSRLESEKPANQMTSSIDTNRFVSRQEHDFLKAEHERLKQEMQTMKQMLEKTMKNAASTNETRAIPQEIEGLRDELSDVSDLARESAPGSTKFLLTGFASAGFLSERDGDSAFSASFAPIFLWQLSDRILFESEFDVTLQRDETDLDLERAQIVYLMNDFLTLGAGKFLSPMNFLEDRLHQAGKLPDRPIAIQTLLPENNIGLQARGAVPIGGTKLDYAFYVANAPRIENEDAARLGTLEFDNFSNFGGNIAVGGRVGFFPIPELQLGYGFQISRAESGGEDVDAVLHSVDFNYVRDSEMLKGTVNLLAQWAWSDVEDLTYDPAGALGFGPVTFNNHRNGGYVQLAYRPAMAKNPVLRRLEPIIRYEQFNRAGTPGGADQERWTFGLDYWLMPNAVLKTAYRFDDTEKDVLLLQFKIGF